MSDLTINHSDLVSEFTNVTGIDNDRAKFYLESAAWDLQVALASFYEDDNDIVEEIAAIAQSNEFPQHTSRTDATFNKSPPKPVQPKFGTLASLKKDEDSSDEEEGQAFYAGGSERSGQQVIGPGKKKNDIVAEMFKAAKDHGAEVVDLTQEQVKTKRSDPFKGTGHRLGATETDSSVIHSGTSSSSSSSNFGPPETVEITLKMWRNGFSIDNGALRDYHDPSNQTFLDAIKRGEIPVELIREAKGGEVMLNMEDHRQEDFASVKSKLKAFTGMGHLLGSPVPSVTMIHSGSKEHIPKGPDGEQAIQSAIKVDDSKPVTNVQIRLADGTKLVARLNHHHTVDDLYHYVTISRPQYSSTPFVLMTTFPSTELTNRDLTLKQASLLNAVIVQRLQ